MMDSATCRERVGKLISEETLALTELCGFLEREQERLSSNDVTALEGAIRERQRSVASVMRLDDERAALCRELGHCADARGFEAVLRGCDATGALAAEWARCMTVATRCRVLNDRNGALVSARLRHVQARLATLIQGRGESVSYGPRGAYAFGTTGRVVKVDV
jgi:flagellar biosynthesis protein FlgN